MKLTDSDWQKLLLQIEDKFKILLPKIVKGENYQNNENLEGRYQTHINQWIGRIEFNNDMTYVYGKKETKRKKDVYFYIVKIEDEFRHFTRENRINWYRSSSDSDQFEEKSEIKRMSFYKYGMTIKPDIMSRNKDFYKKVIFAEKVNIEKSHDLCAEMLFLSTAYFRDKKFLQLKSPTFLKVPFEGDLNEYSGKRVFNRYRTVDNKKLNFTECFFYKGSEEELKQLGEMAMNNLRDFDGDIYFEWKLYENLDRIIGEYWERYLMAEHYNLALRKIMDDDQYKSLSKHPYKKQIDQGFAYTDFKNLWIKTIRWMLFYSDYDHENFAKELWEILEKFNFTHLLSINFLEESIGGKLIDEGLFGKLWRNENGEKDFVEKPLPWIKESRLISYKYYIKD